MCTTICVLVFINKKTRQRLRQKGMQTILSLKTEKILYYFYKIED